MQAQSFSFPSVHLASPEGLLAMGGDLSSERLLEAYRHGIFPWYEAGQPILWWSPDPRAALNLKHLRINQSLRRALRKNDYRITLDQAFDEVIQACAEPRPKASGTWIVPDMIQAYCELHKKGYAHSIEAWQAEKLVGGIYGVSLGCAFFGESMFSRAPNASKIAFVYLAEQLKRWHFDFIDCQILSPHLTRLGAINIPRTEFIRQLKQTLKHEDKTGRWQLDTDFSLSLNP